MPFLVQNIQNNSATISTNTDEPVSVRIYNSIGQIISEFNVTQNHEIRLDHLRSGIYYVVGIVNGDRKTGKFIKN